MARIFPSVVRVDQTEMARDTAPAPDLQRAPSLRNSTEEDGLRRALEIVKKQGDRYKNHHTHGLSPLNFFLGLLNVGLSAFILGRAPEFYWAWATLKSVVYLGQSWRVKLAERKRLYLLDLCWVLSFAYTIATTAAFVAWVSPPGSAIRASLTPFTSSPVAFRAIFALANGPLGAATVALGNALVLHSATQTAALFIHISPPIVTWALRWHAPAHAAAFPGILPVPASASEVHAPYLDLVRPALILYFAWWLAYTAWLLVHGRHHGHVSKSKHDTIYHSTLCNPKLGKPAGFDPKDPAKVTPVVWYMLTHAFISIVLICISPLWWRSYVAHTAYVSALLATSVWNGAKKYFYMMTTGYERALEKLLPEYQEKEKKTK